ncbi:unnamed protein product, partial [Polarella glacialis]
FSICPCGFGRAMTWRDRPSCGHVRALRRATTLTSVAGAVALSLRAHGGCSCLLGTAFAIPCPIGVTVQTPAHEAGATRQSWQLQVKRARPHRRCSGEGPAAEAIATPSVAQTPLWTLKVTQLLIFAANVCLARYITVYYDSLGLSRKTMGMLLVIMPLTSFFGGLFWSSVVDQSGAYRRTLIGTSIAGVAVVFAYLLPAVRGSLSLLMATTVLHGFLASPSGPIVDGLCLK